MKLNAPLSFVVFLLLTSPALSADKDELQGTWVCDSAEIGGEKVDALKGKIVTFSGDKVTTNASGKEESGSYKTDDRKSPKQITLTHDGKDPTVLAIYRIEDDTLIICALFKPDSRATTFDSKHGSLLVYKRRKK